MPVTYLKSVFRSITKNKAFSFITIIGLAVSMTACCLIYLYINFQLSYDSFHSKADRIYRVVGDIRSSDGVLHWYKTPGPMAKAMTRDFPEVEEAVRIIPGSVLVRRDNIKFQETHSLWVDGSFFKVFDFPLVAGDPHTALDRVNSVVFSETTAHKYFGDSNPIGKSLYLSGKSIPVMVTGVMKDFPGNSHIRADMLISMSTYSTSFVPWIETDWADFNPSTYLLLSREARPGLLESKFNGFFRKYAEEDLKKNQSVYTAKLERLKDVYLRSSYGGMATGDLQHIYVYSIIAIFILFIACINFINLTTARSIERAREVGIRKCAGASRAQLIARFLSESVLVSILAWLISSLLCVFLLPLFNRFSGENVGLGYSSPISYFPWFLATAVCVGLVAGVYPAFVLSSFKPVVVLKSRFSPGIKGVSLRKALVVLQFTISICLLVSTLIAGSQLSFMRSRSLGFNKDRVLVISNEGDPGAVNFKKLLADIPAIEAISTTSAIPGRDYDNGNDIFAADIENSKNALQHINLDIYNADTDFLKVFGIQLLSGNNFSDNSTKGVILNKTAAERLGYSTYQQAIGKRFVWGRDNLTIVGVVNDFHFHSLRETVQPMCLFSGLGYWQYTSVKISGGNLPAVINSIRSKWQQSAPIRPFNYFFLDQDFDNQYLAEEKSGHLFQCFSFLALFISVLGLLGLSSYSTMRRTREIGIRKTLGASVSEILNLLIKDFVRLVILSFIISCPISWILMNKWLQTFAYRTTISWEIFAVAGIGALLVALGTISFQVVSAALANPVKSLRTE